MINIQSLYDTDEDSGTYVPPLTSHLGEVGTIERSESGEVSSSGTSLDVIIQGQRRGLVGSSGIEAHTLMS